MAQIDAPRATELIKNMKRDALKSLNKYSIECSQVAVNSDDPHSPVIACAQMALASAALDHLKACGVRQDVAAFAILNITAQAMERWMLALTPIHTLKQ